MFDKSELVQKAGEAKVCNEVLALAGIDSDVFCEIDAASEKQRSFALDLMIKAVARCWNTVEIRYPHIKQDSHFARALVRACMEHRHAAWWCKRKSDWQIGNPFLELGADVKRFLDEESKAEDDGSSSAKTVRKSRKAKALSPVLAALQLPEGFAVRKVGGCLKVTSVKKIA